MKTGIRAARDETATKHIVLAATKLAQRLNLDASAFEGLEMNRGPVELQGLFQREAVANLLDAVVKAIQPDAAMLSEVMTRIGEVPGVGEKMLEKIHEAVGFDPSVEPEGEPEGEPIVSEAK